MNAAHINRILSLVRTTAEHVIVADTETDSLFVVMPLDEYEHLSNAVPRKENPRTAIAEKRPVSAPAPAELSARKPAPTIDTALSDQLDFTDASWKNDWESAFLAEHADAVPNEEEEEEEKFYLEPLE